jgi:hypothetical protein
MPQTFVPPTVRRATPCTLSSKTVATRVRDTPRPWHVTTLTVCPEAFLWSDDTEDADGATPQFSKSIYDGIFPTYPQPHLVLNHETVQTTSSQVLPYAVPKLKAAGYKLVAVDTCLGSSGEWPYAYVGPPQQRDSTWVCAPQFHN